MVGFKGHRAAVSVCLGLFALSSAGCFREFIYPRTHTPPEVIQQVAQEDDWDLMNLAVADGIKLVGLEKAPHAAGAPWLLFFGGNAMTLPASAEVLGWIRADNDWGLAVYAYRGYDGSTGDPDEQDIDSDALAITADLTGRRGFGVDHLYPMGHSLGTGVAAQLADSLLKAGTPPAGLALLAPYTSLDDAATEMIPVLPAGWMIPDHFNTRALIPELRALHVLIVHGAQDNVISVDQGRLLARELGDSASYFELPGRSHNDIFKDPALPGIFAGYIR